MFPLMLFLPALVFSLSQKGLKSDLSERLLAKVWTDIIPNLSVRQSRAHAYKSNCARVLRGICMWPRGRVGVWLRETSSPMHAHAIVRFAESASITV